MACKAFKNDEALKLYDQALDRARTLGDKSGQAEALRQSGIVLQHTGERQKALERAKEALRLYKGLGTKEGEAGALELMGSLYDDLGQPAKGLEFLQQALLTYEAIGSRKDQAGTLVAIGQIEGKTGNPQAALETFQRALELLKGLGEKRLEMAVQSSMASVFYLTSQTSKAIEAWESALAGARAVGDRSNEAAVLGNLGLCYKRSGQLARALELMEQALQAHRAVGGRQGEASALFNIGTVLGDLGKRDEARERYDQALALFRAVGDPHGEAQTLNSLGLIYQGLGDIKKARECFEVARASFHASQSPTDEAIALNNIALVCSLSGELPKALELYQQALELSRKCGDRGEEVATLINRGFALSRAERWKEAAASYDQALPALKQFFGTRLEARVLLNRGLAAFQTGDHRGSLSFLERALGSFREVGDRNGEAVALDGLGAAYNELGEWQRALASHESALSLSRQLGNRDSEACVLTNTSHTLGHRGEWRRALDYQDQAIAIFHEIGKAQAEARVLSSSVETLDHLNDLAGARERQERALALFCKTGDRANEAQATGRLASIYLRLGNQGNFREYAAKALTMCRAIGDRKGEGDVLPKLANAWESIGEHRSALKYREEALALFRQLGDKIGEANMLGGVGYSLSNLGEAEKARKFLDSALKLFRELGGVREQVNMLRPIAHQCFFGTGEIGQALDSYEWQLQLLRRIGKEDEEEEALNALGYFYARIGQPERARDCHERALAIDLRLKSSRAARSAALLGQSYSLMGRDAEAVARLQQALKLSNAGKDDVESANALCLLGEHYLRSGRAQIATAYLNRALQACRSAQASLEPWVLSGLGSAQLQTGLWSLALENHRRALDLFDRVGPKTEVPKTLGSIAADLDVGGRLDEAERHYQAAVALLETQRESLGSLSEAKGRFLASRMGPYERYVDLMLRRGKAKEAFDVLQKAKARVLLDLLEGHPADVAGLLSVEDKKHAEKLRRKTEELNRKLFAESIGSTRENRRAPDALREEAARAEREWLAFSELAAARRPGAPRGRLARTVTLQGLSCALSEETALLEYACLKAEEGQGALDRTVLFVATRHEGIVSVEAYDLKIKSDPLRRMVESLKASCSDRRRPWRTQAAALYKKLMAPAAKRLRGKKRLIVCPDGPLWDLPFQVIVTSSNQCLIDAYEVDYAYSASAAKAASVPPARPGSDGLREGPFIVANPDFDTNGVMPDNVRTRALEVCVPRGSKLVPLPGTQREAQAIRHLFPRSSSLLGKAAQEASVKKQAGDFRYIHFATHAFVNDAAPMLSGITLARPERGAREDGVLTALEISNMDIPASLVVLSACNTGRGEVRRGEGVMGLCWAFQAAGARSQVLSKWAINDASTATLMANFYGRLKRGQAKGAALRSAALDLKHDGVHSHPYFWAPFVLLGDWRR